MYKLKNVNGRVNALLRNREGLRKEQPLRVCGTAYH